MRCIALFSGGLDSMLAVRMMQDQGVDVEAVNFKTIFTCCQDESARAARLLGVRLTVVTQEDDYLELVRHPRFGYGKGANPCVDCRIYMFQRAARLLDELGAQFVVSGEVLGQRLMSQKKRDLEVIAHHAGLRDLLLRPLSAQLLPETKPEREGWVDRARLGRFVGASRKGLIDLARKYEFPYIPTPSNGCSLTEVGFAAKVHDLVQLHPSPRRWDFELLKTGRHYRFSDDVKVVVSRRESDGALMELAHQQPDAGARVLLKPRNFTGPVALLLGPPRDAALAFAAGLVVRHAKQPPDDAELLADDGVRHWPVAARPTPESAAAKTLSE